MRLDGASERNSLVATRVTSVQSANREEDRRKKETLRSDSQPRARVAYGILSAVGLLPALVDAVRKSPAVEDVRAEVTAVINWKNNGLLDIDGTGNKNE